MQFELRQERQKQEFNFKTPQMSRINDIYVCLRACVYLQEQSM